jgi:hypothetical protein
MQGTGAKNNQSVAYLLSPADYHPDRTLSNQLYDVILKPTPHRAYGQDKKASINAEISVSSLLTALN